MFDSGDLDHEILNVALLSDAGGDAAPNTAIHLELAFITAPIETNGSTHLTQVDNAYFLYASGVSSGPQLSFFGTPVVAGQTGPWTPIAAEAVIGGYEVAWKAGTDQYLVWKTDLSGAYVSTVVGPTSQYNSALQALEPRFLHDLNGDGTTGIRTAAIETNGSTHLTQVADAYYLYPSGGSSGPQLSFFGTPVVAGQTGPWTPISAEPVSGGSGGYEVAWKAGTDQYLVWRTDSSGAYVSTLVGPTSGINAALQARETSFLHDLNGDGTTGIRTAAIETNGSTHLTQVADAYYLHPSGGSSGPQLSFFGAPVVAGQTGPWTPISAEAISGGYEVAWKAISVDQYIVWKADLSGAYLSTLAGPMSGYSSALQSLETSFQHDLNGDTTTGIRTAAIDISGSTHLTQIGDAYYLNSSGGSLGPQLSFFGMPVVAGQTGSWTPIAAEQTPTGYEIAWKMAGVDLYLVWATNSSGAYTWTAQAPVAGSDIGVRSLEAGFQQDLNGDTAVASVTPIETSGSTSLVSVLGTYFAGGATGIRLNNGGTAFLDTGSGGWAPIGVEAVGGGYWVAFKRGTDDYAVWTTDSHGTYLGDTGVVSGRSWVLQTREATFQQNLNGDGTVGAVITTLETFGATVLTQFADAYFINGTSGTMLNVAGTPVTTVPGGWAAFSAEQMVGGYRIALRLGSTDTYTVWTVAANGSYLSDIGAVSGSSTAFRSFEPAFSHNLNGDAVMQTALPVESFGSTRLTQVLDTYFLNTSTGVWGSQINLGNIAVTPSRFDGWTPIGAEQSGAANYLVALKRGGDQYWVWTTNIWGSYVTDRGVMSGSSTALQSLEPNFAQDLNSDGTIGITRFEITVRYSGSSTYQSYFTEAARRWEQVITADLPNVVHPLYGFIDDLMIDASVEYIDGANRVLGRAGPDAFRSGSNLPTHGIMQFDSADITSMVNNGTFMDVVLHEMGHVLGIGTLWSTMGLKSTFTTYNGAGALEAFRQLSGNPGAGTVPLESTGGTGTAGVHWSDSVFGNELMTGFISGRPNPLSIMTIGSLRDLGYTVNYGAADPYTMPGRLESSLDLSGLIASNADPASAWYGVVDGFASQYLLSMVDEDEEEEALS